MYRTGREQIATLGLALEAADVPSGCGVDALFLHRPFDVGSLCEGAGVLASHAGFDRYLTTGENWSLASHLGWTDVQPFVVGGRILGLRAAAPSEGWDGLLASALESFGGWDEALPPTSVLHERAGSVALVNAMRPALLSAAHDRGVRVYVTGQFRGGARQRAEALGMGILALGHKRSERWGLQQLARELSAEFPDVHIRVFA
ncbi:hypothetical protein Deipe_3503 [Deinococcus peraridilitoris DSM 19664]|uniref:Uncharacterized protein n=1 Tax=Deinococcus peraridilitoris (strain DSM 19664 / LMG 22246 / CIP 109416 / KR-200) TaxID=937777 RepID=L0A4Z7_DEIPD|nr:hypothetical protein Deipe_3503 [Deinococcus peraridilitoris DSM 19664]